MQLYMYNLLLGTMDRGADTCLLNDEYKYDKEIYGMETAYKRMVQLYPGRVHKSYEMQRTKELERNGEKRRWPFLAVDLQSRRVEAMRRAERDRERERERERERKRERERSGWSSYM